MKRFILAFALTLAVPTLALAWGPKGHKAVAEISLNFLSDAARDEVENLLGEDDNKYINGAIWPDQVRDARPNTAPWHFVDIPVSAKRYDPVRDCREHHGCVVEALDHFKTVLADSHNSVSNRAFALMFVVHLVGDLHQPLHCADNNDRGGNELKVIFFGETNSPSGGLWNLHAVWDVGLIEHSDLNEVQYARKLSAHLPQDTISALQAGTTVEWALQSHSNAVHFAYLVPPNHKLAAAYFRKVGPVLDDSLLKGGLRLARVLNDALGR